MDRHTWRFIVHNRGTRCQDSPSAPARDTHQWASRSRVAYILWLLLLRDAFDAQILVASYGSEVGWGIIPICVVAAGVIVCAIRRILHRRGSQNAQAVVSVVSSIEKVIEKTTVMGSTA